MIIKVSFQLQRKHPIGAERAKARTSISDHPSKHVRIAFASRPPASSLDIIDVSVFKLDQQMSVVQLQSHIRSVLPDVWHHCERQC
jgi:hypothetical protein